jgi:hypothetical protein
VLAPNRLHDLGSVVGTYSVPRVFLGASEPLGAKYLRLAQSLLVEGEGTNVGSMVVGNGSNGTAAEL